MGKENIRETQLAVIGGGPGGYAAAFHAAELGMKVALVNADGAPGGVCLHRGCIPSKALLHAAKLLFEAAEAKEWGIDFKKPKIDLDKLRGWKESIVNKLAGGVTQLCQRRNVDLIEARAEFVDSKSVKLFHNGGGEGLLRFEHAIIATGSSPAIPGVFKLDDPRVWDSTAALELKNVPENLLIVGGGYIGLEMGCVYAALGSKVSVVEMTSGLLPGCDRDLVRPLQARIEKVFDSIRLNTTVLRLSAKKEGIEAFFEAGGETTSEVFGNVLVAIGRVPNSKNLGLENTQAETIERGFIKVDKQMRTGDPKIFAIGDVAGEPMLAHKASREGIVAAEVISGAKTEFDNVAIPAVVFTDPEIAWCGLTETEAKAQGRKVNVARFPWAASGRAATLGRTEGSTKILFDPDSERVLGVGIVGSGAGELIAEGVLAVEMAAVAEDLAASIHAHPTLSETIMESAEALFGHATHLYRPKR
jgi:dihydrolipoamide dehydrogenase